MNKEGSTIGGLMDTVATLTSISLQYGVPLESLGEEVRLSALRAVGLHQEPGHPQRHVDHRLRLPLARLPVHQRLQGSHLAEQRAERIPHEGTQRDRQESDQPPRRRPPARMPGHHRRHHATRTAAKARRTSPLPADTHAERVQAALGNMYHGHHLLELRLSKVIRAGACGCCTECGTSQGCS